MGFFAVATAGSVSTASALSLRQNDHTTAAHSGQAQVAPPPSGALNLPDAVGQGAVADGDIQSSTGTDNSAVLRAAILRAEESGDPLFVPAGTYLVTETLPLPSRTTIFGAGVGKTVIFSTSPGRPVFASKNWMRAFGGNPAGRAVLRDMTIRAEQSNPGSHSVILRDYYSELRNLQCQLSGGDGVRLTSYAEDGSLHEATLVENVVASVETDRCGGVGLNQVVPSGPSITDAHISDLIIRGSNPHHGSIAGVRIPFSAGWQVRTIHTYGKFTEEGVTFGNMWGGSILDGAHIEHGWETAGLRLPNAQRGGIIDNIAISSSVDGTHLEATKHRELYPGEGISVGTLKCISMNSGSAGTAVTWNSTSAPLRISNFELAGTHIENVTPFGGTGSTWILVSTNTRVLGKIRDSANRRTLTVEGMPLAIGSSTQWSGEGDQLINVILPKTAPNSTQSFLLTIASTSDYTGPIRASYAGLIIVGVRENFDGMRAQLVEMASPRGFQTPPSVEIIEPATPSRTGQLEVRFSASHNDGYGTASLTGAA